MVRHKNSIFGSISLFLPSLCPPHEPCFACQCTHLPVQDGLPRRSLLADGTLLHLLHGNLVLSIQQLQTSEQKHRKNNTTITFTHTCFFYDRDCGVFSPVFIEDRHLGHKRGFSLLPERGAPPLSVDGLLGKIWRQTQERKNDRKLFNKTLDSLLLICPRKVILIHGTDIKSSRFILFKEMP